jgi:ribosomal protein S11
MFLTQLTKNPCFNSKNKNRIILLNYIILLKQTKFIFRKNLKNLNFKNIIFFIKNLSLKLNKNSYNQIIKNEQQYTKIIKYIIKINLLNSNIIINITNLKGTILASYSSGILNFTGNQKTKNLAIMNLLKKIKHKIKFLKNPFFAIHFKGIKKNRRKILKEIKKDFKIKTIKLYNFCPHNGCRTKKTIRKK